MLYALESTTYQTSGRVDFKNAITANIDGIGRELGLKTAFGMGVYPQQLHYIVWI